MFKSWLVYIVIILLVAIPAYIYITNLNNIVSARILACDVVCLESRLYQHIWFLSEEIGERHFENPGSLDKAADYIMYELFAAGLRPVRQSYDDDTYHNVIAEISGSKNPEEIIIVGAHYDTVWLSPGANDNASGVAAMLEISRNLAGLNPERTIRFVAFTNEEQPFAGSEEMGSMIYARHMREQGENIIGMYSLEMLGYYSDDPGSQSYPPPLSWFYPDWANFIAFVSNIQSGRFLWQSLKAFRHHSDFPVQGLIMPEKLVPDIRRSDHASFWDNDYPAVMVTDTAEFRNIHYHTVGDTIRTLNMKKMAEVTAGFTLMLASLSGIHQD